MSARYTTRSSSVWPTTSARSPPSRISLSMTTSPARSKPRAATTFIASLSMTSCPWRRSSSGTSGDTATRNLRPGGEDVDRAVVERLEEHAVAARRLRQPVDLLLERDHLVAGLAQRLREALVAVVERGDAGLRLGKAVFEDAHVSWAIRRSSSGAVRLPARGKAARRRASGSDSPDRCPDCGSRGSGAMRPPPGSVECSRKLTLHTQAQRIRQLS